LSPSLPILVPPSFQVSFQPIELGLVLRRHGVKKVVQFAVSEIDEPAAE